MRGIFNFIQAKPRVRFLFGQGRARLGLSNKNKSLINYGPEQEARRFSMFVSFFARERKRAGDGLEKPENQDAQDSDALIFFAKL